ncbi:MAG: hypothetical protein S4CHLAM6_12550 [Chlamydiae bacterium]|nr:hypothetical protein [Chlamydiota bacterium]
MIVERVKSFFDWLEIDSERRGELELIAEEAALLAEGMTHLKDYLALAALLEFTQPKQIFEIGTYKGITSDFFMQVLPHCRVISIAYINPRREFFKKKFNNSELSSEEIGSYVTKERKSRFTQLIGNSHDLVASKLIDDYGQMDMIFIDGDHSVKGVQKDTELALEILKKNGTIGWHDANPKDQYTPVRKYLENQLEKPMLATYDDYIGGVACWNKKIEEKLQTLTHA